MESDILELIFLGESQTLELKKSVRDAGLLAKLIGSFANAEGGKIVVGVDEPSEIVGVDERMIRRVYDAARGRLTPEPKSTLSVIETEGKRIAVIEVENSSDLVLSNGSAYIRQGTMTQPMAWTQMRQRLPAHPGPSTIETLTKAIERQSKVIDKLDDRLAKMNSWPALLKQHILGFVLGVAASVSAAKFFP